MPKICYEPRKFSKLDQGLLDSANVVIDEYMKQGYNLTVRQLYYQFVARDLFPLSMRMKFDRVKAKWVKDETGTCNNGPAYTKLQGLISVGRLAGQIDWLAIVDRTRGVVKNHHYVKPKDAVKEAHDEYKINKWFDQPYYVEVWVEKEALAGVLMGSCSELDVPFFACRGYTSSSAGWEAGQRITLKLGEGKKIRIIHLGDHDPSGIDMTRDIKDRLSMFAGQDIQVIRIGLNMNQIQRYNPPPNWAKKTDSRYAAYAAEYGEESWELDSLQPPVLVDLVRRAVLHYRNEDLWKAAVKLEEKGRKTLKHIVQEFGPVCSFLKEKIEADNEFGVKVSEDD